MIEADLGGLGGPSFDAGVVDDDAVVDAGDGGGVGERDAAGVLVEWGTADGNEK